MITHAAYVGNTTTAKVCISRALLVGHGDAGIIQCVKATPNTKKHAPAPMWASPARGPENSHRHAVGDRVAADQWERDEHRPRSAGEIDTRKQ